MIFKMVEWLAYLGQVELFYFSSLSVLFILVRGTVPTQLVFKTCLLFDFVETVFLLKINFQKLWNLIKFLIDIELLS
jgi:hypothetical protein